MTDNSDAPSMISRRGAFAAAGACLAMASLKAHAAPAKPAAKAPAGKPKATFSKDPEAEGMMEINGIHEGKGKAKVKLFRFDGQSAPAYFIIYDLPPGSSEGTHVHFLDNHNGEGSFDEYYYIMSGSGQMEIDGKNVPVTQGDHVHTPLEVAHGIENTHATDNMRVFLTFIQRGDEIPWMEKEKAMKTMKAQG